jgi:hypothetical protein
VIKRIVKLSAVAAACSAASGGAFADDWSVSGFVRQEIAIKTGSDNNIANQQGNTFNGVTVANTGLYSGVVPSFTRPASLTKDNRYNEFISRLELNLDGKISEAWSAHFKLRGIADEWTTPSAIATPMNRSCMARARARRSRRPARTG